jgi:hypothetical protein
MAILTKIDIPDKGLSATFELNKADLNTLVNSFTADTFWQSQANWSEVTLYYRSTEGNQRQILQFDPSQGSPQAEFFVPSNSRDIFQIEFIYIRDAQSGFLAIPRSAISTAETEFDVDLGAVLTTSIYQVDTVTSYSGTPIAAQPPNGSGIAFSFWVKLDSEGGFDYEHNLLTAKSQVYINNMIELYTTGPDSLEFKVLRVTQGIETLPVSSISGLFDQWNHFVVYLNWDDREAELFLNGVSLGLVAGPGTPPNSGSMDVQKLNYIDAFKGKTTNLEIWLAEAAPDAFALYNAGYYTDPASIETVQTLHRHFLFTEDKFNDIYSQSLVPNGDFEVANPMTFVNHTENFWEVGSVGLINGANSMYISSVTNGANQYNPTGFQRSYAYFDYSVPAGGGSLSFLADIGGESLSSTKYDYLGVHVTSNTSYVPTAGLSWNTDLDRLAQLNLSGGLTEYVIDLSDFAGQTIRIGFEWRNDSTLADQAAPACIIDDISFVTPSSLSDQTDTYNLNIFGSLTFDGDNPSNPA